MVSLKDETIAKLAGKKESGEQTVSEVKKQADDMTVIDNALNTARKLSGADALQQQLARKDQKIEQVEGERNKAIEDKHKAEIDKVETALAAKIDGLAQSYTKGATKESIAEQIAEIKKAASELGMGGSKVSEIREMMNLITALNPQKSLVDQIKDAKELISAIIPPAQKGNDLTVGGVPAAIALELKKMDTNLQITLENMKDDRQRRDQEFALKIKQYDQERADKIAEANARIAVENKRNEMFAGGLETIGRAIGRGMRDGSGLGGAALGSIGNKPSEAGKSYHIELQPNETADFACPLCSAKIGVGPDSTQAQCVGCNNTFPVIRKAAESMPESPPSQEQ